MTLNSHTSWESYNANYHDAVVFAFVRFVLLVGIGSAVTSVTPDPSLCRLTAAVWKKTQHTANIPQPSKI